MEREVFLRRVGAAVMTGRIPEPPRVTERLPEMAPADLIALFRQRAQGVSAVVHGPMSRHGVPKAVTGIASGHGAASFMAWDELPAPGVHAALATAGLERVSSPDPATVADKTDLARVHLGVTGSDGGLAESGSVILTNGPGRPRMASLIADIHVAILETRSIERTISQWAHRHPLADTSNLVVVTGPSRTGDIELELNLGVHGPRHLHVVLIT